MKYLLAAVLSFSLVSIATAAETKKECVIQKDKTGKEKQVCKTIKVHKKLEVKDDKK